MSRSIGWVAIILGALFGAYAGVVQAAELVVDVIRLQHRSAEQLLPLIQPVVSSGTVTGAGSDLVVRATPTNLAEVRKIVARLDRPPRRLVVTVRQDAADEASDTNAGTTTYSTRAADADRSVQRVQVSEGRSAYLHVGQSVPVVLHPGGRPARAGTRGVESPVVMIRETMSGFVVRPRLVGDSVSLDIEPRHDVPGSQGPGSLELQRIATSVSGPLGAWIEVGAVLAGEAASVGGASYSTRSVTTRSRRILVRVDAADEGAADALNPSRPLR